MRTLKTVLDFCPVPMVVLDDENKGLLINKSFTQFFGYDMDDLPNVNHWFVKAYPNDEEYRKEQERVWIKACSKFQQEVDFKGSGRPANVICKDGSECHVEIFGANLGWKQNLIVFMDTSEKKKVRQENKLFVEDINQILVKGENMKGILPLCSFCKKIRDDKGFWEEVDVYISKHSEAVISHGICPECSKKHYPDYSIYEE